ncbi:hypothetical protein E4U21_007013 [Claviceps maximensis]|nr:hypothetical protein E4U21_007013 [Claviceps maximensis]
MLARTRVVSVAQRACISSLQPPIPQHHQRRHGDVRARRAASQLVYRPDGMRDVALAISWTSEHILVRREDDDDGLAPRVFEAAALRDSCACRACRDISSGQKTFGSVEMAPDIGIAAVRATEPGLAIRFTNEMPRFARRGHEMVLPWTSVAGGRTRTRTRPGASSASAPDKQYKTSLCRRKEAILGRTGVRYWDAGTLARQVRRIDYRAFMEADSSPSPSPSQPSAFWDAVVDLLRLGIVYLHSVPRDESSVVNITTRIASIRETFYGRTFDVRAKPRADNIAYTSGHLGLHQDLCYLSPPPMIQVLHCMDNSCAGGESLFSDGERVGRLLWPFVGGRAASAAMAVLADHAVPYQYDKHARFYHAARSVIQRRLDRDDTPSFAGVCWSPPFQGRYHGHHDYDDYDHDQHDVAPGLRPWIPPARIFHALINHPDAVHTYKMQPGECVLFDNLRVLHGRTAFDATARGSRWLRGAYISAEDFLSRAAYIPHTSTHGANWTPDAAEAELRGGPWWADIVARVRELDPRAAA